MALGCNGGESRSLYAQVLRTCRSAAAPPQPRWSLLWFLTLPLLVACSSGEAAAEAVATSREETATIIQRVTASVLITSLTEESPSAIKYIDVTPSSIVVDRGESVELSAQAFGSDGQRLDDVDYVWTVADPRSGRITRSGTLQASLTPGVFEDAVSVTGIQNTADGIQHASAAVTVTVVGERETSTLASVAILPDHPRVLTNQIYRLKAVAFDENGLLIPGVSFMWQVNNPALGRVNDIGYLTVEGGAGTFREAVTVTAIWEGVRDSETTDVTVLQTPEEDDFLKVQILPQRFLLDPRDRLRLRAVALNGRGELVTGTQLRWRMTDPAAGTIDGTGMFVAGETPGIYTEAVRVEAVVPGERGFVRAVDVASVVIRKERASRRLEALRVLPRSVVVEPGGRVLMIAQAVDGLNLPADQVTILWEATQEGVGSIDDHGSFMARGAPGTYREALRVTAEQQYGEEIVSKTEYVDVIITGVLSQVDIHPKLATMSPGRTVHFSVTGRDQNGVKLSW